MQQEISEVQHQLDDLRRQLESLSAEPEEALPSVKTPGPRVVEYRLPLAHLSDRRETEFFVCEGDRVTWIDLRALSEAVDRGQLKRAAERVRETGEAVSGLWQSARGEFDYRYEVVQQNGRVAYGVWLVPKPGHQGETAQQAAAATSEFSRKLAASPPETTRIEFAVRSDSFDLYRTLRLRLYEQGYEVNWKPLSLDQRFQLGAGAGIGI